MGETADVVRRAFDRLNEGDDEGLLELFDESVTFQDVPEIPGSRQYRGHEGIREWLRTVRDAIDDLQFQRWEMLEAGNAVAVETGAEARGQHSGAQVGWRFWTVWRVRDGRIYYHHGYSEKEDALADLEGGAS